MTTDNSNFAELPVIFRVLRDANGDDLIALFPTIPVEATGMLCLAMRPGGSRHAVNHHEIVKVSRPATEAEYRRLKVELSARRATRLRAYAMDRPNMRRHRHRQAKAGKFLRLELINA